MKLRVIIFAPDCVPPKEVVLDEIEVDEDYLNSLQEPAKSHYLDELTENSFEEFYCYRGEIINDNSIGVFEVDLKFEPKCTAKRLIKGDEND